MIPRNTKQIVHRWLVACVATGGIAVVSAVQAQAPAANPPAGQAPSAGQTPVVPQTPAAPDAPTPQTIPPSTAPVNPPAAANAQPVNPGARRPTAVQPRGSAQRPAAARQPNATRLRPNAAGGSASQSSAPQAAAERQAVEGLKERSAESNVVFGQIVDVDDRRLNMRDGEDLTGLSLSPRTRIEINGRRAAVSDLRGLDGNTRIQVFRDPANLQQVQRIVVGGDADAKIGTQSNGSAVAGSANAAVDADRLSPDVSRGDNRTFAPGADGERLSPDISRDDGRPLAPLGDDSRPLAPGATETLPQELRSPPGATATGVDATVSPGVAITPSGDVVPALDLGLDLRTSRDGVVVGSVLPTSIGGLGGFVTGDVITTVDGQSVRSSAALTTIMNSHQAGDRVVAEVMREGTPRRLTLTLPQDFVPSTARVATETRVGVAPSLATVDARKVTPVDLGWELKNTPEGAFLLQVQAGGVAETARLRAGDIVTSIDGRAVTTPGAVFYELHRHPAGKTVEVGLLRDGRKITEQMILPETHQAQLLNADLSAAAGEPRSSAEPVGGYDPQAFRALQDEVRALRAELDAMRQARP